MNKVIFAILAAIFFSAGLLPAQTTAEQADSTGVRTLTGVVLDKATGQPLPYANIYVLNRHAGTITNEDGHFILSLKDLKETDTVQFKYVGYSIEKMTIAGLDTTSEVYMKEEIFNLNEILVFGYTPDVREIVKKIVKRLDFNYKELPAMKRMFIRERYWSDMEQMELNYKKSSFEDIGEDLIRKIEEKIPEKSISYTDLLANIYFSGQSRKEDSVSLKINPVRIVSLKDKNLAELKELTSVFAEQLKQTSEGEYWKVRSGVFSHKLEPDSSFRADDTLKDDEVRLSLLQRRMFYTLKYSTLRSKDDWEFLYKTGKYKYSLAGGTRVNGEDVYIIDFEPDDNGMYTGRMYVSMETYALIRADYEYAPDRTGVDFHLFGVGYTEDRFHGSIYFEKRGDRYELKYFSKKAGAQAEFDRNILLIKKKERFLFDKTLNEIKVGIRLKVDTEQLVECLVLDSRPLSPGEFEAFRQQEKAQAIYVDKFDDNLWKGYEIIEPTRQMRDYKKVMNR